MSSSLVWTVTMALILPTTGRDSPIRETAVNIKVLQIGLIILLGIIVYLKFPKQDILGIM
jgi:hypothetical protein